VHEPAAIELVGGGAVGPMISGEWDCNVYAVRGSKRSVLVDAGAGLTPLAVPPGTDAVLLTHLHFDHAGGAAALGSRGLAIYAHPWTVEGLRAGDAERSGLRISQERGFYPADFALRACDAEPIRDGAVWDLGGISITALETPGHADGHLSFVAEDETGTRTLLAGDLVFPGGHVVLQPLPDCRLDKLWDSVSHVRAFDPQRLYSGHCAPSESGAIDAIETALAAFSAGGIPTQLAT
jgi:glyoxylase-like metal-dependent hydrolase (beta-lactamase superfamily II)